MDPITVTKSVGGVIQNKVNQDLTKNNLNPSFGDILKQSIEHVNQAQKSAGEMATNLVTGKDTDIHRTMIAMEKAGISFQLLMQIRNKLVSAYQEVYRMQV